MLSVYEQNSMTDDASLAERDANGESDLEQIPPEALPEPQMSWVESNSDGTVTEEQYRQQCMWVFGQFGHMMECVKDNISTDEQAAEWLEMKQTIAAAKSVSGTSELAGIRSTMIPVWLEYVTRMNYDTAEFGRVCNK